MNSDNLIIGKNIEKVYKLGDQWLTVLNQVSLQIPAGQFVGIMGPSGSGKSTLLHLLGGLDTPTSGNISIFGRRLEKLSSNQRAVFRGETVGFIFQAFHLIPTLNALENVALPGVFAGIEKPRRDARAAQLLKVLGMSDRMTHRPHQLSGGQQQRVAIARALFNDPPIIMADEPTGALDSKTGHTVMKMLRQLSSQKQKTIIVVTHDAGIAQYADRLIHLRDGHIVDDERLPSKEINHAA
jgi:macrolide transport system ATP-binding/permease protein